jgi:3'(2'), 5'-bisphosphate nucleotidase
MRPPDHCALARVLLPSVLAAGRIELRHFTAGVAVERKADASPVTAADREAEAVLVEGIAKAEPGVPVVAEESLASGQTPRSADAFFLVDPLDGTREFIKGCPEFTINIGLIVDRRPVFGIVYAPVLEALYVTLGADAAIHVRTAIGAETVDIAGLRHTPLRTRAPDVGALVALESRSHRTPATEAFLARYDIAAARQAGSSVKFCRIAAGEADLYPRLGTTCEWDTAAGHAILAAAGGSVATLDGRELVYGKSGYRNPDFVAWGRRPLAPAR